MFQEVMSGGSDTINTELIYVVKPAGNTTLVIPTKKKAMAFLGIESGIIISNINPNNGAIENALYSYSTKGKMCDIVINSDSINIGSFYWSVSSATFTFVIIE